MITVFRWDCASRQGRWLDGDAVRAELDHLKASGDKLWIDLADPTEAEEHLVFDQLVPIHALSFEDVTRMRRDPRRRPHLPKAEEFPDHLFVIVNPLTANLIEQIAAPDDGAEPRPLVTQLSAVLTENRLVLHHYDPVPAVAQLRTYLERHCHQADRGPDYMFHLVLDAMVDEFAPVLDCVTDDLDGLEEEIFKKFTPAALTHLLHLKRHIITLRKTLVHEREVLARLSRGEFALIDERETVYYRNVYDHLVRFTELTESAREMISDLMQTHLAVVSNRLNEIMKALTMISTIVLPMGIVTGLYGMNFEKLYPAGETQGGFWIAFGLMVLAGALPLAFFKWKKWI